MVLVDWIERGEGWMNEGSLRMWGTHLQRELICGIVTEGKDPPWMWMVPSKKRLWARMGKNGENGRSMHTPARTCITSLRECGPARSTHRVQTSASQPWSMDLRPTDHGDPRLQHHMRTLEASHFLSKRLSGSLLYNTLMAIIEIPTLLCKNTFFNFMCVCKREKLYVWMDGFVVLYGVT